MTTEITVVTSVRAGVDPGYVAFDQPNGMHFLNTDEDVQLHVKNDDVGAKVLTITTPRLVDGNAVADPTVSIPAGEERIIGPFSDETYGDAAGGKTVVLAIDSGTSVTIAAVKHGDRRDA